VLELLDSDTATEFETRSSLERLAIVKHLEWVTSAHPHQIPPDLELDWAVWLLLAGRGAGKTRCAAETLWWWAWIHPNSRSLVLAPTSNDIKHTCIEGESGLLAVIPESLLVDYNKQDHLLTLTNGSTIRGISADSYERLRGPQFHFAWCDELAAFEHLKDAWDMMTFGLRLGTAPRVIATTTPKPKDLILELVAREGVDVVVDRASTYANISNLAGTFTDRLEQYKGTKLYNQEVLGELVDLEEGKVVSRDMFNLYPAYTADGHPNPFPNFEYIVMSLDCAFSEKTHNDPTACTVWGVFKPLDGPMSVLLIDAWAEHLSFPDLKPRAIDEFQTAYGEGRDAKRPDMMIIEDKAAGISLIQELARAGLPCRAYNPGRADKMQRLQIVAAIIAAGRVWLPESETKPNYVKSWAEGFVAQICAFPDAVHDDYVDTATQALRILKDGGWLDIDPAPRYDDDDFVDTKPARVNPYSA
jgi:predicted phage terminase large subunit-like protein